MNSTSAHRSSCNLDRRNGPLPTLHLLRRGTLAGLLAGAAAAAALALANPFGPHPVTAPLLTSWLLKTAFAMILAGLMGAWSGGQVGLVLSLLLVICRRHYGLVLLLAPCIGLAAGVSRGQLADSGRSPRVRPVVLEADQPDQLFELTVQLAAALTTSWTLAGNRPSPRTQLTHPGEQVCKFGVCDTSQDDDNEQRSHTRMIESTSRPRESC